MSSPKRLARVAGILYLLVAIAGGFAEGFVEPKMYVAGDAAATAANLVANSALVRAGVLADLADQAIFLFVALTLYLLLKHVQASAARTMLVLVAVAAGIGSLNTIFELVGLRIATDATYASAFGIAGSNALALVLLDLQHYGLLAAQIFFGLWLIPLGYLAYRSAMFPRALGVALVIGGLAYIVDLIAKLLIPGGFGPIMTVPSALAELWMVGYLLVFGIRSAKREQAMLAPA